MCASARPTTASGARALPTAHLFGLPITLVRRSTAMHLAMNWASSPQARLVVTPNTDHFLRWQRDAAFRDLYEAADLSLVDGAPLVLLARLEHIAVSRFTGASMFFEMAEGARADRVPLILVGGLPGVARRAARKLKERYPGLSVPVTSSPSSTDLASEEWLRGLAAALREHPQKVVALCLGSPKQEALFRDLRRIDPQLSGVFLCVGAVVDFAAGTLPRAPKPLQWLGLEWLFRLAVEPRRLWRRYLVDDMGIMRFLLLAVVQRFVRPAAVRARTVK